jgi:predicted phosphodiesterase
MMLGDIHGNFNVINQYVKHYDIKDAYIIQVGDFGVGFSTLDKEKRLLKMTNDVLVKRNVIVYAIRGNHDYKPYFDNDPFGFSNIKLVKDYTVLNLEGKNILCIGGAISVDRKLQMTKYQLNGDFDTKTGYEGWWPDEGFIWQDDKLINLRGIDVVVTHTAPDYCIPDNGNGFGPFVNGFIKNDPELKLDLLDERRQMTLAFQTIKMYNDIYLHVYGHFHRSDVIKVDGVQHRVLGVGELWEERDYYEK